jgi:hypothetical protein
MRGVRGITYRLGVARQKARFAWRGVTHYSRLRGHSLDGRPRVAAVLVGRNDDYMPDFRERLVACLEWNTRYLVSEVVFVEWNPPADRDLLAHHLTERFPSLRAYVVPAATHDRICQNPAVKLLEYHAKNVGIRRAQAPFIFVTNADAAVGLDSVSHLQSSEIPPDVVWTAERIDIPWKESAQDRIRLVDSLRYRRVIPYDPYGTGEFALASRDRWHRARGYDEKMVRHRIGCDVRGVAQMVAQGATIARAGTVLHLTHPTSCTERIMPHHGEYATKEGLPYRNPDDWGLGDATEVPLGPRVWRIEERSR